MSRPTTNAVLPARCLRSRLARLGGALLLLVPALAIDPSAADAQATYGQAGHGQPGYGPAPREPLTYNTREIIDAGHQFFGQASTDLASVVEYVFQSNGEPTGYIVGQEASGAVIGGLRYGEGELRLKTGQVIPVFWQGPSVGFDIGADGSRILVLVYGMQHPQQIFDLFGGASGLAYMAGGVGVHFNSSDQGLVLGVIRTGVGLRIGINVGYLRFTPQPTWNPF